MPNDRLYEQIGDDGFIIRLPLLFSVRDMEPDTWESLKEELISTIAEQYREAIKQVEQDFPR